MCEVVDRCRTPSISPTSLSFIAHQTSKTFDVAGTLVNVGRDTMNSFRIHLMPQGISLQVKRTRTFSSEVYTHGNRRTVQLSPLFSYSPHDVLDSCEYWPADRSDAEHAHTLTKLQHQRNTRHWIPLHDGHHIVQKNEKCLHTQHLDQMPTVRESLPACRRLFRLREGAGGFIVQFTSSTHVRKNGHTCKFNK